VCVCETAGYSQRDRHVHTCTHKHTRTVDAQLRPAQVYCLPDDYEIIDSSLDDIKVREECRDTHTHTHGGPHGYVCAAEAHIPACTDRHTDRQTRTRLQGCSAPVRPYLCVQLYIRPQYTAAEVTQLDGTVQYAHDLQNKAYMPGTRVCRVRQSVRWGATARAPTAPV
jgi:hypothetical protein